MNLIESLEGVLGASRALPPPFGRVPGGPEGAKVVPWSDFRGVSGGPRHLMNSQMEPRYPLGPFQAPKNDPSDPFDICEGPRQALRGRLLCFLAPLLLMFRAQEDAMGPKNIKTHTYSASLPKLGHNKHKQ